VFGKGGAVKTLALVHFVYFAVKAGVAQRATFLVDPDGVIRFTYVTDLSVGRNPAEVLSEGRIGGLEVARRSRYGR
jgi:peroxiredoxin